VFGNLRNRWIVSPALAFAMAAPALGQSADGLRPALEDVPAIEDEAPAPEATRLEAGEPAAPEEAPARRRREDTDPYAPQGLPAGAFRLFPVLETGAAFSTNPALAESGADSDLGIFLRPSLKLQSQWSRHQLDVNASGDLIYFLSDTSADAQSAAASSKLRLDVLRSTTLDLDASYTMDPSNDPGDPGKSGFDNDYSLFASLAYKPGRIETRVKAGARLKTFGDISGADNSDLDYAEPELSLRATYDLAPAFKPYAEAGYRPRAYFDKRDRNGIERSSQGAFVGAGFAFDLAPFWEGNLGGNYLLRDFDDASLDTSGAFGANASIVWRPTDLWEVTLAGGTSLSDSSSDDVEGSQTHTADLDISYDIRENVTLNASAGIEIDDLAGGADDFTFFNGADAIYRATPWLAFTASYDYLVFDGAGAGDDYDEHRVTAGIELRR
jgi:hypothetical protein